MKHKIGNKYMRDCEIVCFFCASQHDIRMVAHRGETKKVTGYLFMCRKCFEEANHHEISLNIVVDGES